jgi:preprotein translocase subunit YajC
VEVVGVVVVGGGQGAPPWLATVYNIGFLVLLFGLFYFLLIAPQRRKQKEQRRLIESVQKGAKITTIGGIYGTVLNVEADSVTVKIDESNNTRIKLQKAAIAGIEQSGKD